MRKVITVRGGRFDLDSVRPQIGQIVALFDQYLDEYPVKTAKSKHAVMGPVAKILERVEDWPAEWQEQLADIAFDIDAGLRGGVYYPTPEELAGIDRGLRDAEQGRFATDEEVQRAFAKFRGV